ncbi:ornithine carbamoyltransferase [candidate division KSB1 bacterium]|nr:ornithine carbamoyltransferase [candidate division KSB1 bacterium]
MKKDFLKITDIDKKEIDALFQLTKDIKDKLKRGETYHPLKGNTLAMIFQKPSTRTRISFETGMFQLGGHALYISPSEMGFGTRESAADIGRVLSRYNDIIMARLFGHDGIEELAKYSSVPVINGLTDLTHPCQILADAFTIIEHRGSLDGIKVTYVGDGNNVANSWLNFAAQYPLKLTIAVPKGYEPNADMVANAQKNPVSEVEVVNDPFEGVKDADVIYTDVWASMGQEAEAESRKAIFKSYQVNDALVAAAKPGVLVMHCLPAHRGEEITNSVIEGPHSIVFDEAENRLHVQKAIMVALMEQSK